MFSIGEAVASTLLAELKQHDIDMNMCRGQCYDGASNMSGAIRGCASLIRNKYPRAVYQHCHSHMLNLSLMKACTFIPEIGKCI